MQDHQRQISFGQMNNSSVSYGFVGRHPQQQTHSNLYYDQTGDVYNNFAAGNHVDNIGDQLRSTTNQRVAAAMYPDSINNDTTIPSTQFDHQQTAVQKLAEPSQVLVHSIVNLINYEDDAELATRALPELIKLLNDEDQVVVSQAAMVVHQLSRKEASRHALCSSAPLVKALLHTLEGSNDLETTKFASEILNSLSEQQQGLLAIFKTGGIKALIYALSSPVDAVVSNALITLHNLLLHQEGAKMTVRLNGGLQKMVNLLQKDNFKFLAIVADCLHLLAYGNQEGKLIILASGGPAELVRILHSYSYEKLLYTTTRVIKVLSVCSSNKPALIQAGGMQALALCLDHPSKRLAQECLWALRNLSDGATKEINLEPLLQRLVQLLDGNDINMVTCAVGTLSNLTCNNPSNKVFVCKVGGIQALVQTLRNAGDRDEIIEPAICALRHLTNGHSDATLAQDAIRIHGGLPDVFRLLVPSGNWPLLTACAGLVKNLTSNPSNSDALRDLGIIQKLTIIFNEAYQVLQRTAHDANNIAGIRMERVVESVIAALHSLAIDSRNRSMMDITSLLPTLISFLYNENENLVLVTLDLLTEFARSVEIAQSMNTAEGIQIISNLVASPSEAVRQRAALLLSLVSGDKTPEYTQRLSNEINTLFQSEPQDQSRWIEAPNQDMPSVYNVEGQIQAVPILQSDNNRQSIYNTSSTAYMTQHDIPVSDYGTNAQPIQSENSNLHPPHNQSQLQAVPQPNEPWFDTDL